MQADKAVRRVLVAVIVLAVPIAPLAGQVVSADASVAPKEGTEAPSQTTVCMSRAKTNPANGRSDASRKPTNIAVPEMQVASFTRKGFEVVDCGQTKLDTKASRELWRDKICKKAAFGNRAIQNQYARIYGAQPAALCASAQRVSGRFDRTKLKRKRPKVKTDK